MNDYQRFDNSQDPRSNQFYHPAYPQQPQQPQQLQQQHYPPPSISPIPQYYQPQLQPNNFQPGVVSSPQYVNHPVPLIQSPQYGMGQTGVLGPTYVGVPGHVFRGIWSDGMFDCFDSGIICLLSLFLPCVRWAQTVTRAKYLTLPAALALYAIPYLIYQGIYSYLVIHYPTTTGSEPERQFDTRFDVLMLFCSAAHLITVVIGAYYRNKIRTDYYIQGNALEDCCWHLCCQCCAIAQEARHIDRDLAIPV